jgi:hypothetical protein
MFQDELIFDVDFNDLDASRRVVGSLRFGHSVRRPDVGEWVYLQDGEGNGCRAQVVTTNGDIVYFEPDWSSWLSDTVPTVRTFAALA